MGLDMYLTAERYLFSYPEDGEDAKTANTISAMFPELNGSKVKTLTAEIGYWRKANQIHAWFVENIQDGEDECKKHYVSVEKLQELLDEVNEVLDADNSEEKALELLPPTSGFFFGSAVIDEYYFNDLKRTKDMLEGILSNEELIGDWDIYYQSSW